MADEVKRPHGFQPEERLDREGLARATNPDADSWRAGEGDLRPRDELHERMGPIVDDKPQRRGVYPGTKQDDPTKP